MGIARSYIRKIHKETGFYAAWTPSLVLALGDYGTLDPNGAFERLGNVVDLGFSELGVLSEPRPDDFLSVTTESGTSITVKAAGQTLLGSQLPEAKVGLRIVLADADALVCKLHGARHEMLEHLGKLQSFVAKAYEDGRWTKDWRIVTQRIVAEGTTLVYSETDRVEVEATAEADVADIADADLGLSVVHWRGGSVHVVGARGLVPFVSLVRLRNPAFGPPKLRSFTREMVTEGRVVPVLMEEVPE